MPNLITTRRGLLRTGAAAGLTLSLLLGGSALAQVSQGQAGGKNEVSIHQTKPVDLTPVDSQANLVEELIVNARLPGPAWWKVSDGDTTVYVMGVPAFAPQKLDFDDSVLRRRLDGANVLIIGFGRVGQIASQGVLARGASLTIIDHDTQVIRDTAEYGFKVYYGDGSRPEVLHAAGA